MTGVPESPWRDAAPPGEWGTQVLGRLGRLVDLRAAHDPNLNAGGRRLLQQAIFSTYVDCRDLGLDAAAQAILDRAAQRLPMSPLPRD